MMIGAVLDSPVGRLRVEADENVITTIFFHAKEPVSKGRLAGVLAELQAQLRLYFSGQLEAFDLPLAPKGTPFQQDVWKALTKIPYGETRSYAEIAKQNWPPRRGTRGRSGQRSEPDPDRHPLPPCDRQQRQVDRLRRRITGQAFSASVRKQAENAWHRRCHRRLMIERSSHGRASGDRAIEQRSS